VMTTATYWLFLRLETPLVTEAPPNLNMKPLATKASQVRHPTAHQVPHQKVSANPLHPHPLALKKTTPSPKLRKRKSLRVAITA
jgi:hypothetical protein